MLMTMMNKENYRFHYSRISNQDKPLILFLHGFMGDCYEFDEAIELLSDEFSYLKVDLPGHGKTQILGGDECYTMANTAAALIALLDKLNIAECFLVGYSMGGRLGLYLSLHFPQRFSKVILESASPGLRTEAERLQRVKQDEQIARKLARSVDKSALATFFKNWYQQPIFGAIKNHPQFDKLIEKRLENNPIELAKSLRFMGTGCQPSLWEKLKDNTNPLLLLIGEYDEKFIAINKEIAQICKLCQLEVISNCGHNIHLENTIAFVKNIRQFL
jgi:2-succinyl-6-hydroxy-2,4-cyclohexadiene-1-carboxylate synthase